ncbi:MAG: cellulase family glycosylhydrolase [Anaerolineae bacterium]
MKKATIFLALICLIAACIPTAGETEPPPAPSPVLSPSLSEGQSAGEEAAAEEVEAEDEAEESILSQAEGEPAPPAPAGAAEASPEPGMIDKWSLWVDGPHLRGANIWQAVVIPELDGNEFKGTGRVGPPYSQEDFNRLAALGANYVSISGPGLFTESPPYTVDPGVEAHLDHLLAMIAEADMFATIGFRTGPGRSEFGLCCEGDSYFEGYFNDSVWEDQAAQDAWVEMWRYTAERYRDNPIVAGYKLMVEPNSAGVLLDIYDPDEFYAGYGGTLYDWNQLYPRLVDGIRQVDPDTPILVGGNGWSGVAWLPSLQPVDDRRTVYVVHQYEPQDQYTHQEPGAGNTYPGVFDTDYDGEDDRFDRAWLDNLLSPVDEFVTQNGAPVAVDEYGLARWQPGAAGFMDDQMALFEARGLNYALWEWQTSWAPFAEEVHAFDFRLGPDPDNRREVPNDLMDVITRYWARNTIRPSNLTDQPLSPPPAKPVEPQPGQDQATYETRPDGAVRLSDPPPGASDQNPAFSPDGDRLLFTRFENGYNDGPSALYLLDLTSGAASLLTAAPDSDNVNLPGTSWNAATGRITFASDRQDADEVWTLAGDGSDLYRVTHHTTPGYFIEPSFSPDGAWIVFEADPAAPEEQQQGSIWKVRADGSSLAQLTDGPGGGSDDRQPNWSPSGERILFQRRLPGSDDWNLYTMTPDGGDLRQVTFSPAGDTDASWSPDGRRIVYSSDHGGLPVPNIFVIPAEGGQPVRVTDDETHEDGAPSWSPDGRWIAFESHPGQDEDTPAALWLIAAPALEQTPTTPPTNDTPSEARLAGVRRWLYLIDVDLEPETVDRIADSTYDMVVLDFIPSEANNTGYPMAEVVERLHNAPQPKLVVAYIDIGQAEDYRTYWQPGWGIGEPEWIVALDPDGWQGNFPVAYWHDEWRDIWLGEGGYLPAILEAGFDGVYLDWVEAYSDENVLAVAEQEGVDPRQEMIGWVEDIAGFGRAQRPGFIVIAQNAAELAADDGYLAIIDAIAQEQVWFDGGADNNPPGDCPLPRTEAEGDTETYRQSLSPPCREQYDQYPDSTLHVSSEEYLRYLTLARDKGEIIFTVDYALEPENIAWVYETSRALGFVPFVGNRALDRFLPPVP